MDTYEESSTDPAGVTDGKRAGSGRPAATAEHPRPTVGGTAGNVVRGGLIGLAETIPGVSGGTVALVTGIYERLIGSGKALTDVPKALAGKESVGTAMRRVDWWLLLPVAVGMLLVVFTLAGTMESFVTDQPVASKALFMGMIAASIAVPLQELRHGAMKPPGMRGKAVAVFVLFAVATFWLTSMPTNTVTEPPLWAVFLAASVAICALVLPGVSGSFFLLVVGLYAPTMAAVDQRNIPYMLAFAAGALVGIVLFVRILEWLLAHKHTLTLVAMSGLLLGSLRALWPWQGESNELLPVGSDWPMALGLFVLGAAIVGVVAWLQSRFSERETVA